MDGQRVLLVDHSKDFGFFLSTLLKFHGIKIDIALDVDKALELTNSQKYGLIITEYMIGEEDGLSLCTSFRNSRLNGSTEIMLITAKQLNAQELALSGKLTLTYFKKPIMPAEIYQRISQVLARTKERRQLEA